MSAVGLDFSQAIFQALVLPLFGLLVAVAAIAFALVYLEAPQPA